MLSLMPHITAARRLKLSFFGSRLHIFVTHVLSKISLYLQSFVHTAGGNTGTCSGVLCQPGQCVEAGPCDTGSGLCTLGRPYIDGTACVYNDGHKCTQLDTCQSGECNPSTNICCGPDADGYCGLCVTDCVSAREYILSFYDLPTNSVTKITGITPDVYSKGCSSGHVCCAPETASVTGGNCLYWPN